MLAFCFAGPVRIPTAGRHRDNQGDACLPPLDAGGRFVGNLSGVLRADAGEVRGFAYYTGMIFSVFAAGPGESIGAGGRYDDLLARFGAPMPAVGFGLDIDALAWALRAAGKRVAPESGVVVVGADESLLRRLRERGLCAVAAADRATGEAYARSWGFAEVVLAADAALRMLKE